MPNWSSIQQEIYSTPSVNKTSPPPGPLDIVRKKYLQKLQKYTKRNIIAYYSGFLHTTNSNISSSIFDGDMNAFMNAIHDLDKRDGLDIILHTPGGSVTATEGIVNYLHSVFGLDIRCFIPQLAMSGGTMIACACKEIYMGKHSNIGPIDPQFGGIAAYGIIEEYERAVIEIEEKPSSIPIWQTIFNQVHPSWITECHHAIDLSSELVTEWLISYMNKTKKEAQAIVKKLNNHTDTKTHGRHINMEKAIKIGLNVIPLENDDELQDLILTVHHAYMETFNQSLACKIIENHNGVATVFNNSK